MFKYNTADTQKELRSHIRGSNMQNHMFLFWQEQLQNPFKSNSAQKKENEPNSSSACYVRKVSNSLCL